MEQINLFLLQLLAGIACGRKHTCGNKIIHDFEHEASARAERLNASPYARNPVVAYACPFCWKWHIGREMEEPRVRQLAGKVVNGK